MITGSYSCRIYLCNYFPLALLSHHSSVFRFLPCSFIALSFNSFPVIRPSFLIASLCSFIIFLFHFSSTCPLLASGIYLLSPFFFCQGSVFEGTIYGLEAYTGYSLKVEALNGAGGLIMQMNSINYGSWAEER